MARALYMSETQAVDVGARARALSMRALFRAPHAYDVPGTAAGTSCGDMYMYSYYKHVEASMGCIDRLGAADELRGRNVRWTSAIAAQRRIAQQSTT